MRDADLEDFVRCYHPENSYERQETWSEDNPDGRWRRFPVDFFLKRDKTSFDYFQIKDKAHADLDNMPASRHARVAYDRIPPERLRQFQRVTGSVEAGGEVSVRREQGAMTPAKPN